MDKCEVLILSSLMRANGKKNSAVNRITWKKLPLFTWRRAKHVKCWLSALPNALWEILNEFLQKESWKMFSKKKKKKSWNISYTVWESANFSKTLWSYAEKAFASAESSCLLLTIWCTGTEHLNLDCGHLQVARSTQIIGVHHCTLIEKRRSVRYICQ